MARKFGRFRNALWGIVILTVWGCTTQVPTLADSAQVGDSLVVGRVMTFLIGERSRRYLPEMRFIEFENQDSHARFQVEIDSSDETVALNLPSGSYRLTRVQISEGPFLSMADWPIAFTVDADVVTHVGTWRFGVDSPRYGRMVVASVVVDQAETVGIRDFLRERYPELQGRPFVERLPQPLQAEARLYEVMPYPRYPRMFRRHWW